jgi:excisionase family DNA binding protein
MAIMASPLAHTVSEVCDLSRAGKTTVYQAISSGDLRAVKRGRRTLVLATDLKDWVYRFPAINDHRRTSPSPTRAVTATAIGDSGKA